VTVYLILPSEKLSTLSPLMRLWLGLILRIVIRKGADESRKTLFLIDEAAHIGKIQILEDAITLMRAYGIRIWLFFQSVGQLQTCYGEKAQTILENAETQQFFGTNAFESADHISNRIGDCTVLVESINRNRNRTRPSWQAGRDQQPGSFSSGSGVTIGEAGRRLLKPEEILILPDDVAIIFHKNRRPIAAQLVPYFAAPEFKHGRTGRTRGVGPLAVLFSVVMFGFAAVTFLGAASLSGPASPRRAGFESRYDAGDLPPPPLPGVPPPPSASEFTIPPASRSAVPSWRRSPRGLSGRPPGVRSGYPAPGRPIEGIRILPMK
jgi:type IV secretion system protein VirD4